MPGISPSLRAIALQSASRSRAVVHCPRGIRPTLYSVVSQPLTSLPSSGMPSWSTTYLTSGKEHSSRRTLWVILAASEGEMDWGRNVRTHKSPSSSFGRNSEPRKWNPMPPTASNAAAQAKTSRREFMAKSSAGR